VNDERHTAHCNLCGHTVETEALRDHLQLLHGIDLEKELLRWPDGEPVVVEEPEPGDFA
jgi:hypothetical protein